MSRTTNSPLPTEELAAELSTAAPTLEQVRQWPATVSVPKACTAFGISRAHGYVLAARGEFPATVLRVGTRWRVSTASVLAALD